jgi:hypothetical protein
MQTINEKERTVSVLDLGNILSNYFRLTPDKYTRIHYQEHLDSAVNPFDPQVSWDWIRLRVQQDSTPIKNLDSSVNDPDPVFGWDDFDPQQDIEPIAFSDFLEFLSVDLSMSEKIDSKFSVSTGCI